MHISKLWFDYKRFIIAAITALLLWLFIGWILRFYECNNFISDWINSAVAIGTISAVLVALLPAKIDIKQFLDIEKLYIYEEAINNCTKCHKKCHEFRLHLDFKNWQPYGYKLEKISFNGMQTLINDIFIDKNIISFENFSETYPLKIIYCQSLKDGYQELNLTKCNITQHLIEYKKTTSKTQIKLTLLCTQILAKSVIN